MSDDWIIEVLSDLRRFSSLNGMPALVEQLDRTLAVAASEIAARHRLRADAAEPLRQTAEPVPPLA